MFSKDEIEIIKREYLSYPEPKRFNIFEFLEYARENKDKFRNYCEIILTETGSVVTATPSHQDCLLLLAAEKHNTTIEKYKKSIPMDCLPMYWIISKEGFMSIWYNNIIAPFKHNRFQERSIKLLKMNGLIASDCKYSFTKEYENYIYRMDIIKNRERKNENE